MTGDPTPEPTHEPIPARLSLTPSNSAAEPPSCPEPDMIKFLSVLVLAAGLASASRAATGAFEPGLGGGHANREGSEPPAVSTTIYGESHASPAVASFAPRPMKIAATYTGTTDADN